MDPQLFFKDKERQGFFKHVLVLLVSLFLVLLVLANYGSIVDLTSNLSYTIFPSKKTAEYEKLTAELIALYGSGKPEYYQGSFNDSGTSNNPAINNYSARASSAGENPSGNYIYIPEINVNAPIIFGGSTDGKTILDQLKLGTLVYPGSSLPGNGGSTVIIGHSSSNLPWQKYGRIFSSLPELSRGDMIIVSYNGRKYSYAVDNKITGSVNELASLNLTNDLILGTCWPIGTDEQRILITASLVSN
ncbi:MAG: hypothetical protein A2655_04055 [Candidatus Yanofskybacteria bacterium RIFCSPHIGHO2_01_FULL_43_42]|uniref:Sortase n=1 Tax=Candidatus Yanofskybacteria bacterium RIFCSPLOWO2_01_FULL_43_22 TaxID=1802695 RepID=A0A1F8GE19_9BACT|nr:MAG: hypothetical protein A2655_04055 [Candidatus Yanofskybacteria bacterium RIFCSPHIGHO2_01_FULL_43_42]OGN12667.1 MAG: hypothetical protein A3D48_01405 [Candidatus Yanofskybacteria bacterium RIFCSPHIGHO2_02_FULL_43_17]OGN23290.1 MAG: hypothetical protein A3A13_04170 [Candidatus Yanofskybacteria bacterium RIFCSPLOWO2_01_FULL_43_22]